MLSELRTLMASAPTDAGAEAYRAAVVDDNVLGKSTASTRQRTHQRLGGFYGVDPGLLLFRALRDLWYVDATAQPLLALLSAMARDPILRAMTPAVLDMPVGTPVTPCTLAEEGDRHFPGSYGPKTLAVPGKNVESTWQ